EAGVGGRAARTAGDAQRKAERRAPEDEGQGGGRDERDRKAYVRAKLRDLPQPGRGRQRGGLQEAGAELAERPRQHLLHEQKRDEVEQQGGQNLMHTPSEMDRRG